MLIYTTEPKARKQYRCDLCLRIIEKGEKHLKHVGSYDGEFYSMRKHISCDKHTADWEHHDPQILREKYLGETGK